MNNDIDKQWEIILGFVNTTLSFDEAVAQLIKLNYTQKEAMTYMLQVKSDIVKSQKGLL